MASLTFTLESLPAPARATKVLRLEPRGEWTTTDGAVVGRDDYVQDSYARGAEHALDLPPGPWVLILGTQKFAFDLPTGGGDLATLVAWGIPANTPQATINAAVETFGSAWLTNFTDSTLAAKVTGAGPMKAALDGNYVRFVDQNGDPLPAGSVTTIHVNTVTGEIDDITFDEDGA